MAEAVLFPDVEQLICDMLRHPLLNIPVVADIPSTRPNEFVRVIRTGGPRETLRSEAAILAIEGWAQTKSRAVVIINQARAILGRADAQVFGVREISGPAYLPDPETFQVRYTITIQARVRGVSVTV